MKVVIPGGEVFDLGATETTPTVGITDYSRRVTDDYGVTTVVARGFARRMSVRLGVPTELADAVLRKLAALRASTAQWVANDAYACLAINGFLKDFDFDFSAPPLSYCTLTVEGLAETEPFVDAGGDPAPFGQTSTLRLLQPATITDAALVSSNVPETDYTPWGSGTSYALGARVIKADTHRIYESAVAGNVGSDPVAADGKWLDIGPTNRWALFDRALGSTTTAASPIAVTVASSPINAVALLDVVGTSVQVQATGYDKSQAVGAGAMTFLDLPAGTTRVTVTLSGSGTVSVGTLLVGKLVGLGVTEAAPTAGITDYSRKDVDDFGAVTVVERAWAKRMTAKGLISTAAIDSVFSRIAAVRATPSLWIGQDGYDSLTIYGFFKTFEIEAGDTVSKLSLSIEGLSTAGKIEPFSPGSSVDWPNVGDPDGTKPANNATNGRDPNSPLGSTTVGDFERQLATARAQLAYINDTTIPTINTAVASGRQAASDALAQAVALLNSSDAQINRRIDSVSASGGYNDTNVYAEISRVDQTAISRDGTIGQRIDSVITNYQTADTNTNARVDQVATSASNATTAVADLTTSVNTRFSGVNTTLSGYDGRITTLSSTVQGFAGRTDALEAQLNGSANSNLLSRATSEATAAVDAKIGAVAQSIITLSASIGGFNLLSNTTFVSTDGWGFAIQGGGQLTPGIDASGDQYHPPGEHVLSIFQGPPVGGGAYSDWQSSHFPVSPSRSYQFYAFVNSHRCLVEAILAWFDASGQFIGATLSGQTRGPGGNGNTPEGFTRVGSVSATPPSGAASGAMWLRKHDTDSGQANSYAWFWRPYVAEARAGQRGWNPYSAGTGAAMEATLVQQAGVLAGLDGRTSVYWRVTGTTNDGSTMVQLSKADGSPGLFYIGANLLVDGNAIFNGTVTIRALDRSTMTATSSGSVSGTYGGAGQAAFAYIPNLGADMAIKSGGSIYLTFTGNIAATTDASGTIYASFEILNAADNGVLASVRLPTPGFGPSGRLDNFVIRILNLWGDLTIRWRVATRATGSTWAIVQNPQCSVYWTAL
jgi:hypothetical protein